MADPVGVQTQNPIYTFGPDVDPSSSLFKYTTMEGLTAAYRESLVQTQVTSLYRGVEFKAAGLYEVRGMDPKITADPKDIMSEKDWRFSEYYRRELKYEPMTENQAKLLAEWKDEELHRMEVMQKSPAPWAPRLAVGFLGQATDPINLLIAASVPIARGATLPKAFGKGFLYGAMENAVAEGLTYQGLKMQQADLTNYSAMANIIAGGIMGSTASMIKLGMKKMASNAAENLRRAGVAEREGNRIYVRGQQQEQLELFGDLPDKVKAVDDVANNKAVELDLPTDKQTNEAFIQKIEAANAEAKGKLLDDPPIRENKFTDETLFGPVLSEEEVAEEFFGRRTNWSLDEMVDEQTGVRREVPDSASGHEVPQRTADTGRTPLGVSPDEAKQLNLPGMPEPTKDASLGKMVLTTKDGEELLKLGYSVKEINEYYKFNVDEAMETIVSQKRKEVIDHAGLQPMRDAPENIYRPGDMDPEVQRAATNLKHTADIYNDMVEGGRIPKEDVIRNKGDIEMITRKFDDGEKMLNEMSRCK